MAVFFAEYEDNQSCETMVQFLLVDQYPDYKTLCDCFDSVDYHDFDQSCLYNSKNIIKFVL